MKRASFKFLAAALLAPLFIACNDSASPIGTTLTGDNVEIMIDSAFTVTGRTVRVARIRPKTTSQLLGAITIDNYGTLRSDVVTQFLPTQELDTAEFKAADIDSLFLTLRYYSGTFIGDSIAPLGLTVYPLTKLLPDTVSSGFDPAGYYKDEPLASTTYNVLTTSNDLNSTYYYYEIKVQLPTELGRSMFSDFVDNPANFNNGKVFAENVFPGVYMKSSFGSGRLTQIASTSLTFHLEKIDDVYNDEGELEKDTVSAYHQYMLVTPEVICNNDLRYTMAPELQSMIDEGKNLLVAPAACEMEMEFPLTDIMSAYRDGGNDMAVLNGLTMTIPVDSIENNAGIAPPPYLLMVLKSERDEFFAKNKLTDNKTSFYATYDSANGCYSFASLRNYLLEMLGKESISAEDYTFSLVPVQVNFEELASSGSYYYSSSAQYAESDIQPYLLKPVMCTVNLADAKIKLTYSKLK